jgi:predicted DNA-binding protein with PD1-like motif
MEYRKGTIGRVFSVRFDEGDFFLEEFIQLIKKENIRAGWFHVLGGLREADVVTGPKEPTMPPEPVWSEVRGAREVLGTGTVFWDVFSGMSMNLKSTCMPPWGTMVTP